MALEELWQVFVFFANVGVYDRRVWGCKVQLTTQDKVEKHACRPTPAIACQEFHVGPNFGAV